MAGEYVWEEWVCVCISGYVIVPVCRRLCAGFSCNDYIFMTIVVIVR